MKWSDCCHCQFESYSVHCYSGVGYRCMTLNCRHSSQSNCVHCYRIRYDVHLDWLFVLPSRVHLEARWRTWYNRCQSNWTMQTQRTHRHCSATTIDARSHIVVLPDDVRWWWCPFHPFRLSNGSETQNVLYFLEKFKKVDKFRINRLINFMPQSTECTLLLCACVCVCVCNYLSIYI